MFDLGMNNQVALTSAAVWWCSKIGIFKVSWYPQQPFS